MLDEVLRVLERAYRVDVPEPEWLSGIVATVHESLGRGILLGGLARLGTLAFMYNINQEGRVSVFRSAALEMPDQLTTLLTQVPSGFPPAYVRRTFGRFPCVLASQAGLASDRALTREQMAKHAVDWHDIFIINALDPTGHGIWIGLPLVRTPAVVTEVLGCWSKVAVHLAAAMRLRHCLAGESSIERAEALIEPRGTLAHARGPATANAARRTLGDAVRELERLRATGRRRATGRALHGWKGLVDARWTLVDHFETDGKRYLVAQRNDVPTQDISRLTARERQVLSFASLGHSNKLIAYELGLSPFTIAVFLHHAARKLQVRTRRELIAKFEMLSSRDAKRDR